MALTVPGGVAQMARTRRALFCSPLNVWIQRPQPVRHAWHLHRIRAAQTASFWEFINKRKEAESQIVEKLEAVESNLRHEQVTANGRRRVNIDTKLSQF
jgi:hypothetical protein